MNEQLTTILPMLRRFAYSLTGSMHDADDLVQMTVEKILSKGMPEDANLTKWSFRLCRNVWIDEYRAGKVRQNASQLPELQEQASTDQEKQMETMDTLKHVNKAMQQLPTDQRSILSLVAVQGMSYKEVSETLELPLGTVMSRLSRARASIFDLVGHLAKGATA